MQTTTVDGDSRSTLQKTIENLRQSAADKYVALRNNRDLSREALTRELAKIYVNLLDKMATANAADAATNSARRVTLERKLFGIPNSAGDPSAMISYRDALDRAGRVDDANAATVMLKQASVAGDDYQVRALLSVAYTNAWADVVNAWEDLNPARVADAEELWDDYQNDLIQKPNILFGLGLNTVTVAPVELSGMSENAIRQLAAS